MSLHRAAPGVTQSPSDSSSQACDSFSKVCVVGAGSSGLAVARRLKAAGVPFDCLEREDQLGGNWCYGKPASSVYRSTHLISSKRLTEYSDFPMPETYPEYPHHQLVWQYLQDYAKRHRLHEDIEFQAGIHQVDRLPGGGWRIELESGQVRHYGALVVANGHNWDPRWPTLRGNFNGRVLHSSQYKTPETLAGKRVLVIGGGNSGCDIAVESAQNAASTTLSLRRGYHFLPKFFHGTPIDICGERMLRWRLPLWLRRALAKGMGFLLLGEPSWVGLPKPDHRLFETHPVINSQLIYHLGHGDIRVRPDVDELCGEAVRFADGEQEAIDVIICATGFNISMPFLPSGEVTWRDGRPELYLNVFHPHQDDLFFAGLIQPDSGQFGLADHQAELIAEYLRGLREGRRSAEWFREEKRRRAGEPVSRISYLGTPRHALEVEHFSYRRRLQKLIRRLRKR